jgi:hypothetical protein
MMLNTNKGEIVLFKFVLLILFIFLNIQTANSLTFKAGKHFNIVDGFDSNLIPIFVISNKYSNSDDKQLILYDYTINQINSKLYEELLDSNFEKKQLIDNLSLEREYGVIFDGALEDGDVKEIYKLFRTTNKVEQSIAIFVLLNPKIDTFTLTNDLTLESKIISINFNNNEMDIIDTSLNNFSLTITNNKKVCSKFCIEKKWPLMAESISGGIVEDIDLLQLEKDNEEKIIFLPIENDIYSVPNLKIIRMDTSKLLNFMNELKSNKNINNVKLLYSNLSERNYMFDTNISFSSLEDYFVNLLNELGYTNEQFYLVINRDLITIEIL